MTSLATIAGATPAALAPGPGAETQRPMAQALVGGMAVSMLLTLFVVPAAYSLSARGTVADPGFRRGERASSAPQPRKSLCRGMCASPDAWLRTCLDVGPMERPADARS
jgi:hypothetical protein